MFRWKNIFEKPCVICGFIQYSCPKCATKYVNNFMESTKDVKGVTLIQHLASVK